MASLGHLLVPATDLSPGLTSPRERFLLQTKHILAQILGVQLSKIGTELL